MGREGAGSLLRNSRWVRGAPLLPLGALCDSRKDQVGPETADCPTTGDNRPAALHRATPGGPTLIPALMLTRGHRVCGHRRGKGSAGSTLEFRKKTATVQER